MTNRPQRKSTRLKDYDYSQSGVYFVTLCTHNRLHLFGEITDGDMVLNDWGEIVSYEWQRTTVVRPYVELDAFVVMPNHFHAILLIVDDHTIPQRATQRVAPTDNVSKPKISQTLQPASLGAIVGQFKSVVTKRIRQLTDAQDIIWQRNYHDHIIRNESDLNRIREYVQTNPARWEADTFYD